MKKIMKISSLMLALYSLFSFSTNAHNVKSVKAAKGAGDERWSLIGSVDNYFKPNRQYGKPVTYEKDTWTKDFNFQYNAETFQYELAFTFDAGDEFKIRKDRAWDVQIGYCGNIGGGIGDYLTNAGDYSKDGYGNALSYANFKVQIPGTYLLKIADDNVENYGDKSYGFSLEKISAAKFSEGISITGSGPVNSILVTNKIEKRPKGWISSSEIGESADQRTDDGYMIGSYEYTNADDPTKSDVVIYANVDRIFAPASCAYMFRSFPELTKIEFDCFDTSRVTDMYSMFADNPKLTSLDVSMFHTPCVSDMSWMFGIMNSSSSPSALKTVDISSFDFSNVSNINSMFAYNPELAEIKFPKHFVNSKITSMDYLFADCTSLITLDLSWLDTSNVIEMSYIFPGCTSLKSVDVSSFDTSKVTNMSKMFDGCTSLEKIDLSNFNTSNVTNLSYMFRKCESLKEIKFYDPSKNNTFVTDNVTDMSGMFAACYELTTLDVSEFNTSKVTNMSYMFWSNSKLKNIDLSNFDTSNVTDMRHMFARDTSLTSLDLSNFNTANVQYMYGMFYRCSGLERLDISSFDLSSIALDQTMVDPSQDYPWRIFEDPILHNGVTGAAFMFDEATSLREIKTPAVISGDVSITLPYQYAKVNDENAVKVMDSTKTNTILVPGSSAVNELLNDMYNLNTCTDYAQAPSLRERYNALSDSDKEVFATLTDKDNVLVSVKLEYMEYMYASNNVTNNHGIHMMSSVYDGSSFLVIMIAFSSLMILGYYLVQKRKYAR